MSYTATGVVHLIRDIEVKSDRFRKREFILEFPNERYPQLVSFQVTNDRCEALDEYDLGDIIEVEFSLRGRSWEPPDGGDLKYFNSLEVFRLRNIQPVTTKPVPPPPSF